jgi:hypothetical protein
MDQSFLNLISACLGPICPWGIVRLPRQRMACTEIERPGLALERFGGIVESQKIKFSPLF